MKRGTTYKRKDGRYECRIPLGSTDGKRRYKSFYGSTAQEAKCKMLFSVQTQEQTSAPTMSIQELSSEWMLTVQNRIKESTASNYRMKLEKHILPALGDKNCNMITAKDIYSFINRKTSDGLSARYVADIIVLLKSIYRYASREYAIHNVLDGIVLPNKNNTEVRMLTHEQKQILSAYLKREHSLDSLGVALSLYTGIRIGELCALQWKDIDLTNAALTIRKTIQRIQVFGDKNKTKLVITEPKSVNSLRTIPIPNHLIQMVKEYVDKPSAFVLSGCSRPVEPRTMQNRFKRIMHNDNLPSIN